MLLLLLLLTLQVQNVKILLSFRREINHDVNNFLSTVDDYYNKNSSSDVTSNGSSDSNYENDKNVVLLWDDIVPIENNGEGKETKPI